jgi:hypothetical protein
MSAIDLIRRAVRGVDPAQLLEGLTEANLHVQVIDVANDKMLQDVRGDTKAQSKFDDFAKTYKQPRYIVQIVDIDRDRVLKTNEHEDESINEAVKFSVMPGELPKEVRERAYEAGMPTGLDSVWLTYGGGGWLYWGSKHGDLRKRHIAISDSEYKQLHSKYGHRGDVDEQDIGLLTGNMGQTPKDRCKRARIRRQKNFSTLSAKVK